MSSDRAMSAPQSIDRDTFLSRLRQSGLLTLEQLSDACQHLPDSDRGRPIARALVEQGLITRFQAELLLAGRTGGFILGQYKILDQLGQGGMGRVFKAQHRTMGRMVALKVLSPKLLKTGRAQEFFLREVQIAGQLHHPHIVTAYDANHTGGRYYLVLEYVDGPNLDQLVRDRGPLPVGQACEFIRQIASGLEYAARMGMVHRDLKPANVLIQTEELSGQAHGVAKISDFGLARLADPSTQVESSSGTIMTKPNTILGTPDYLSPEQARDIHEADIRSDLYSIGCTLYYLLTGQVPFPGGSTLDKLIRHSTEEPRAVTLFRQDVPERVIAIMKKLMAKEPSQRYQTPTELLADITPHAQSGPSPRYEKPMEASIDVELAPNVLDGAGTSEGDVITGEEESALISTLPPSITPTPIAASRLPPAIRKEQNRRARVALFLAIGIVTGLLALAGLAAILGR